MKKSFRKILIALIALLLLIMTMNIIVDPYFHYHKPVSFLQYPIEYQRYQNNGIVRNFDYDSIITGSSMTENFKTSELDELFQTSSIKIPESGARFKEINDELINAFKRRKNIKLVVRGLDYGLLIADKDERKYDENWYPDYLYDDNLINDVKYLLNKGTFCSSLSVIVYTMSGNTTTNFDEYSNWMEGSSFGLEHISYSRPNTKNDITEYTIEDYKTEIDNLYQNVIEITENNKNTQFYYFFTPYSILYFDKANREGTLEKILQAEKVAIEMLLKYENINLFSFFDCPDIICDLNRYKDINHYDENVNSYILECMKNNKHKITSDNYTEYCENEYEFFTNYDYDSLFNQ